MVYLCSDTHGFDYLRKVKDFFEEETDRTELLKDRDYLINLGDSAICWDNGYKDDAIQEFYESLPVTTLFLDGNHENFDILDDIPKDEWHGGTVQFIAHDIIHLMRGNIYEIDGKSYFTFGGADSFNKAELQEGLSWWREELPTEEDYKRGWINLEKHDFKVDYMLSHMGPYEALAAMGFQCYDESLELSHNLQRYADNTEFKEYYFGHFHVDDSVEEYHCIMDDIVTID